MAGKQKERKQAGVPVSSLGTNLPWADDLLPGLVVESFYHKFLQPTAL